MTIPCKHCGKPIEILSDKGRTKQYCSKACREKARRERDAEARGKKKRSKPLVSLDQCAKCRYVTKVGTCLCCGYFEIAGRTRLGQHPEGLTEECQEFEPKKRGRKKKSITINHRPKWAELEEQEDYGQEEAIHLLRQLLRRGEEAE